MNSLTNSVNSLTNIVNEQNKKIEKIFDYIKEQKALKENKVDNNKIHRNQKGKDNFQRRRVYKFWNKNTKREGTKRGGKRKRRRRRGRRRRNKIKNGR